MEKIEFYQRAAVIENYRKLSFFLIFVIDIFCNSNFINECHKIF